MENKAIKPKIIQELEIINNIEIEQFESYNYGKRWYKIDDEGNLTDINLHGNSIISEEIADKRVFDISPIRDLDELVFINLTENSVTNIESLGTCKNILRAYLGGNNINDISPLLSCKNLEELILWDNPIANITLVEDFTSLKELYCQNIPITSFEFLDKLKNLNTLSLSGCNINDLDNLPICDEIISLMLSDNDIENINVLEKFEKLRFIDLSNNKIKSIPKSFAEKFSWLPESTSGSVASFRKDDGVNLYNNPLEYPPSSVIELGEETMKDYYESADRFGFAPLSEGRIIVIGDGSAGKSSLIEQIIYGTFDQGKNQTNGIRIENWTLNHKYGRDLAFHIWDFGGQEIQHAVHKFFFTEGCLYLLVLDNRKEEEPEYWLQQIDSFAGGAPVLVVFNKHDQNTSEIADRKYLKEKYPNILGFYNTSCKDGYGIDNFRCDLKKESVKLRTVDESFPNNWFVIKKTLAQRTSGEKHYISYDEFKNVCADNNVSNSKTQKLLLKYFTTIGAVTWFGDTYLNFLHVLSPAWITQGVYKIITSRKTAELLGHINVSHFGELLQPIDSHDYTYDEGHYGYILSMMKKFDLCYTDDEKNILLPSAFGKIPKVEYKDFKGKGVRTYIFEFNTYMPMALIHKFIAKKIHSAYDTNYWYSGIVIEDDKSDSLAMIQADREAKRIYVRIKGDSQLGVWEHVRREFSSIASSYANIPFTELILLDERTDATVSYEDLVSHIKVNRPTYFNPKMRQDFNVGYLMGLFENPSNSLEKFQSGGVFYSENDKLRAGDLSQIAASILINNSPVINVNTHVNINLQIVNQIGSSIIGDARYLLDEIDKSDEELAKALNKVIDFAQDAKSAQNINEVKEKGWSRKLKGLIETIASSGDKLKKIKDGGVAAKSIVSGVKELLAQLDMHEVASDMHRLYEKLEHLI